MAFDPHQLDEIRSKISVSEIVGARFPLIKKGSEYVVKDNESFTVNDKKKFWCEFGAGGDSKPHDIFDFLQTYEGYDFIDAVHELAKRAGVSLSDGTRRSASSVNEHGNDRSSDDGYSGVREDRASEDGKNRSDAGVANTQSNGKREVVKEWNYVDAENNLLYQVVRTQQRMPDGSWKKNKDGKIWKTFMQRRPSPDGDGTWVLGLDFIDRETNEPLEFVRGRNSQAWLRVNDERRDWVGATFRTFENTGNVEHWLYNANDVLDELQEPKDDQRTIFIPEGEAKVDVLKEWGLLGVTNSGGAKHFTEACANFFSNARHVVFLQDNDRAGAERIAKIAPMLKAVGVDSVQALNFRDVWSKCPPKGDVKDWRDVGGGTKEALLDIVDGLKDWAPAPYKSKFGAKTAYDLGAPVRAYPWRIKDILPMHDNALLMGPSRSGKTFAALDICMNIMFGKPFAGRKTAPCGIVYLAYEGATGFENRLRAYMKYHGISHGDLHSFAWLTRPPNMYAAEENAVALADEIVEISKSFHLPLGLLPLDTHNAATRGSSEIKSEDINKIVTNYDIVRQRTGANLMIIGHTNSAGDHRGNQQFFNGIETAVLIERVYTDAKHTIEKRDDDNRVVRRGKINKQREGDDGVSWNFTLEQVEIGLDEDGDPITSMVSVEPTQHVPNEIVTQAKRDRPEGYYLNDTEVSQFKALLAAIDDVGIQSPTELGLPLGTKVVKTTEHGTEFKKTESKHDGESPQDYANRIKASLNRFKKRMAVVNVVRVREASDLRGDKHHFIWPTGRRVQGRGLVWPPLPKKKPEQKPLLAPGETEGGLSKDIF